MKKEGGGTREEKQGKRRKEERGRRVMDGGVNLKITESAQYEYLKRKGKNPAYLPI